MPAKKRPSPADLDAVLGPARARWDEALAALTRSQGPVALEWKPSKNPFGFLGLVKRKDRTLLYLTPGPGAILAAVVLGERAAEAALAADLPEGIKTLIREARPYAEGRGIRFPIASRADVAVADTLVALKVAPK